MYTYSYLHSKKSYEEIFTLTCCLSDTLCVCLCWTNHGVTTVSRIDSIIGLFCRILSLLLDSFAKETYNSIDPTNQSHPIPFVRSEIILEYDLTPHDSAMFLSHMGRRLIWWIRRTQQQYPPYARTTSNFAIDARFKPNLELTIGLFVVEVFVLPPAAALWMPGLHLLLRMNLYSFHVDI